VRGYACRVGFRKPPPPPEQSEDATPDWIAAPDGWLGALLPVQELIGRSQQAAISPARHGGQQLDQDLHVHTEKAGDPLAKHLGRQALMLAAVPFPDPLIEGPAQLTARVKALSISTRRDRPRSGRGCLARHSLDACGRVRASARRRVGPAVRFPGGCRAWLFFCLVAHDRSLGSPA
jgi:hypothetical protein